MTAIQRLPERTPFNYADLTDYREGQITSCLLYTSVPGVKLQNDIQQCTLPVFNIPAEGLPEADQLVHVPLVQGLPAPVSYTHLWMKPRLLKTQAPPVPAPFVPCMENDA